MILYITILHIVLDNYTNILYKAILHIVLENYTNIQYITILYIVLANYAYIMYIASWHHRMAIAREGWVYFLMVATVHLAAQPVQV